MACQSADALVHLHAHAVLHCDVSPGNVMRARSGSIKLADFGLARTCADTLHITVAGNNSAKFSYMAPEQGNQGRPTDRADVWALAATLMEAWLGERPYGQLTMQQIKRHHVTGTPPPLEIAERPLPETLRELLSQCLRFDASERPSAGALYQGLLLARARTDVPAPEPESSPSENHQSEATQVSRTGL